MTASTTPAAPPQILFSNATIISGEDQAVPYEADVLMSDGIIKDIGIGLARDEDMTVVDATGCYLTPGFIDMHAHSDLYLLTHPEHEAKISQGCTTEVVGQDGISYYPIRQSHEMTAVREQIAGWNGNPTMTECGCGGPLEGIGMFQWNSVGEYLDCLERNKTATNVAVLVPQGNLRLLACGPYNDVATDAELEDQISILREGMSQGAVGMSSGLTYTPGMYASTAELTSLCQMLADEFPGAYYAPHHRSYGLNALESYQEMLDIAKETRCPLHLTHCTLNFPENKGRAPTLVKMIDAARVAGATVTLDTYPYLPGCTTLASILPSWAHSGGPSATLRRLEDPIAREKMRIAIEVAGSDGYHGLPTDWNVVQVGTCFEPSLDLYSGRTIAEIARSSGRPCSDVFFEILVKDQLSTACLLHIGNEENVQTMMQHETHCSGTDAILHGLFTHPRAYGTFPRFLAHYARDLQLTTMPQMVAHLTSRPAKRIGMYPHRGLIQVGSAADVVLFDPIRIKDTATYEEPKKKAEGIRWVLVNGQIAMEEGKLTGLRAGRTLRRRKDGTVTTIGATATKV